MKIKDLMKRRKVLCFLFYVESNDSFSNEVYIPNTGGWVALELAICINCGELFVIDRENPKLTYLKLEQVGNGKVCPSCQSNLENTLKPYPLNFLTKQRRIGSFPTPLYISDYQETKIIEIWELP
jgi:hypothetical protein